MGIQAGAAILENSMKVLQKVKNRAALPPRNCTTRYLPKGYIVIQRGTCTPMFIAAMSTVAKLWKEPRCPSTDEWVKKMWYIYTMEYSVTIKRHEILPFAMTWMELKGIMLSEISQSEKDDYMISLM